MFKAQPDNQAVRLLVTRLESGSTLPVPSGCWPSWKWSLSSPWSTQVRSIQDRRTIDAWASAPLQIGHLLSLVPSPAGRRTERLPSPRCASSRDTSQSL